ncbi:MAG: hypothetical protein ABI488_23575 [Polyangiaceae bacterium]
MQISIQRGEPIEHEPLDPLAALAGIYRAAVSDPADEASWLRECYSAVNRQSVPFAVAPRCSFRAPITGDLLSAGDEIAERVHATIGQLLILERRGVVLRATPEGVRVAACPADARWVVAPGQAISCTEGQLLAGAEVRAEWFDGGQRALIELCGRGVVLDRHAGVAAVSPEQATLSLRELDLAEATSAVESAIAALGDQDNKSTQKAYIDAKLHADLAGVRVEHARKAVQAADAAALVARRAQREREAEVLGERIEAQAGEARRLEVLEIRAAQVLADCFRASDAHADATYGLQIARNAILQEITGQEVAFTYPPTSRLQLRLMELGRLTDVDLLAPSGARR